MSSIIPRHSLKCLQLVGQRRLLSSTVSRQFFHSSQLRDVGHAEKAPHIPVIAQFQKSAQGVLDTAGEPGPPEPSGIFAGQAL